METAEVDREDHKEHLPKLRLPKTIVSEIINFRSVVFVNWTVVSFQSLRRKD